MVSILKQVEEYSDQALQIKKYVETGKPSFEAASNLKLYIIQMPIRTHSPVSTAQLMESGIKQGYKLRAFDTEKDIKRIFSEDSMFVKREGELWSLNIENVNGFKVVING